ncbi:MAG: hypothetical protein ACI9HK_006327, partial [Pirellulaceae bacterium]
TIMCSMLVLAGCDDRVIPTVTVNLSEEQAKEIRDGFAGLTESVSAEDYLRLRDIIVESPGYDPYSSDLEKAGELLAEGRPQEAKAMLDASFPNLVLSPRAHLLAAQIAMDKGEQELSSQEGLYAAVCLEGILRSGDGNAAMPYLVSRPSDEYDVVVYLDKRVTGQRLQQQDGRQFDLLVLDDGSEVWFDVTVAFDAIGGNPIAVGNE